MSVYKLCPFCENNATCRSPIPYNVMTEPQESDAHSKVLFVGIRDKHDNRSNCAVIEEALKRSLERNVDTLTLVIAKELNSEEVRALGAVINCRVILHLNHVVGDNALHEIRIICSEEQKEHMLAGLAHSHPLCLNCFEKCSKHGAE